MYDSMNALPPENFLPLLKTDLRKGADAFSRWAYAILTPIRLSILRGNPMQQQEDFVQEVLLHCTKNNCETLKKYDPLKDGTFEGWLLRVATNKIISIVRPMREKEIVFSKLDRMDAEGDEFRSFMSLLQSKDSPPGSGQAIDYIYECIESLRDKCQTLLKFAASGWSNLEIAERLNQTNIQVGNDIRQCRKNLHSKLAERDLSLRDLLEFVAGAPK